MKNICVEEECFFNVLEVKNTNSYQCEVEINSIPIHALLNGNMHKGISRFSRS
jgi:hypothetical protein